MQDKRLMKRAHHSVYCPKAIGVKGYALDGLHLGSHSLVQGGVKHVDLTP